MLSLKLHVKFVLFNSTGVTHSCVVKFSEESRGVGSLSDQK